MRRRFSLLITLILISIVFTPYISVGAENSPSTIDLIDIDRLKPMETYSGFLYPRLALPAFITPESSFKIVLYTPITGNNVEKVYLDYDGVRYDLEIAGVESLGERTVVSVAVGDLPDGLYDLYVVAGGKTYAEYNSVSVKSNRGYPLKILWYSDTHYDARRSGIKQRDNFLKLIWRANFINPDFVIVTGDVLNTATEENYVSFIKDINSLLRVPLILVPGNHDHHYKEDLFTKYLAPSNISINIGPLHLILVDTGPNGMNGWITNEQIEWIRQDLAKYSDMEVKMMASHHPFSMLEDSDISNRAGLEELLQDSDVDLIIHGHMHYSIVEDDKKPLRLTLPNAYEGGQPYTAFRILKIVGPHDIEWKYGDSKDPYPMFDLEVYEYQIQNGSYNGFYLKVVNNMAVEVEGTLFAKIKSGGNILTEGVPVDDLNKMEFPTFVIYSTDVTVKPGEAKVFKIYGEEDDEPPSLVDVSISSSKGKRITELIYLTLEDEVSGIERVEVSYTLDNETWSEATVYRLTYNLFYTEVKHDPDSGFALRVTAYDPEGNKFASGLLNYNLTVPGAGPEPTGGGQQVSIPYPETAIIVIAAALAIIVYIVYRRKLATK